MTFQNFIKQLQLELIAQGEKIVADGVVGNKTIGALIKYDAKITLTKAKEKPQDQSGITPLEWVRGELGQTEIKGSKDNPRIRWYHTFSKNIGSKEHPDEVPWCSSLLNACAAMTGMKGTGSALAKSWINYGEGKTVAEAGDIVVIRRSDGGFHVCLANEYFNPASQSFFWAIGGNQSNSVNVTSYRTKDVLAIRQWSRK